MVTFIFAITQILTVFKPTPIDANQCLCPFNHKLRNKWAWGCPLPLSNLYVVLKAVKQQTLKVVYDYFINIKYIANTFTRKNNLSRQDYSLIPYSFHIKPQLATATIGAIRWPTYSCLGKSFFPILLSLFDKLDRKTLFISDAFWAQHTEFKKE